MARRDPRRKKEDPLEKTRHRVGRASGRIASSLLGPVWQNMTLYECDGNAADPRLCCVEPETAIAWYNPRGGSDLSEAEWTWALAHQVLHAAFRHGSRRGDRHPVVWNLACCHAADNFLHTMKLGAPPRNWPVDTAFAGKPEEEVYDLLMLDGPPQTFETLAGPRRLDMAPGASVRTALSAPGYRRRTDWEALLAEGIRASVEEAIQSVGEAWGTAQERPNVWRPLEEARKWVMNELPLLGALASQLRLVANAELCERMDISIAAVDGFLGEIYFHPGRGLAQDEVLFIYVHELLHAALLHHARGRGRDSHVWNLACDFVINGWLVEMGVGRLPSIGALYDPRVQGMSAEEVYDLLERDPRRCKGLRGFRGKLGDILWDTPGRRIYRGEVTTLDDVVRRCMAAGLACQGRGNVPAGLIEEIRSLFTPPVPWDVELARWMEAHVPMIRDPLRTYARASRRQSSTPEIPRPARYVPQEWKDACTFGVVLDTSGSMDRELLGRALGAIASYAEAREVPMVRLVLCDARPYDRGTVSPTDLRGVFPVQGRGGTLLQPAVNFILTRPDLPANAPLMIITDGWCEEEITVPREHCFVLPRKRNKEGAMPLRTSAPVFRVLKEEAWE
jgi:predicted metal-dependent peptidase